jgi:hypothetical protein
MNCVECQLMEEGYRQLVELGGIDPAHEIFQVFASPFQSQPREGGEGPAEAEFGFSGQGDIEGI